MAATDPAAGRPRAPEGTQLAAVALGSNLGRREDYLRAARDALAARAGRIVRASRIYETVPVGPPQGAYLNQVVLLATAHPPEQLLRRAQAIEDDLGRVRGARWGPRVIDLDLLLQDGCVRDGPALTLPHPRLAERAFVLVPLAEVWPGWRHPRLGHTARELRDARGRAGVALWTPQEGDGSG
jgi:2-amino-4-hydroxy-6-hydroxymethyldihydropteridine diphosphokinase